MLFPLPPDLPTNMHWRKDAVSVELPGKVACDGSGLSLDTMTAAVLVIRQATRQCQNSHIVAAHIYAATYQTR